MSSSSKRAAVLTAVRAGFAVAGVGVAVATAVWLATMPPPPPESDGFAHGMAIIFGSVIILSSLVVATVSIVLPAVLGRDDPLGFNRWQRLALRGAGALVGGGFVLGIVYGYVTIPPFGVLLWLGFVVLAAVVVGATLAWRLGETFLGRLSWTAG